MTDGENSDFSFLNDRVVKIAIFIGIILRIYETFTEEVEPDEMHQWYLAVSPDINTIFSDFVSNSGTPHPSASFIMMWLWGAIFGHSVIIMRIPSIILGILTIIFCGLLAKDWFGDNAGRHAVIMAAVISDFIRISAQARMYSMMVFLVVLLIWLVNKRIVDNYSGRLNFAMIVIVSILLSHTHYFGTMAAFGTIFIGVLYRRASLGNIVSDFFWVMIFLVSGFIPHIPFMITHMSGGGVSYIEQYIQWDLPLIVISRQLNGSVAISIAAIFFVAFCLSNNWSQLEKKSKDGWYLVCIWWIGCFGVSAIISILGPAVASPANLRIIMPATIIGLAGCTSLFQERYLSRYKNSTFSSMILALVLTHLVIFHGILDSQNPEIETAFHESGETLVGERVVLVSNAHGILWQDEFGQCRFCELFQGEIVDTVLIYAGEEWDDDFDSRLSIGSVVVVIELEHWVSEYSEFENDKINSLGQVIWEGDYRQVNARVVSLKNDNFNGDSSSHESIGFQEGIPSRIKFSVEGDLICRITDGNGKVMCMDESGRDIGIFEEVLLAESIEIGESWICILDSTSSVSCMEKIDLMEVGDDFTLFTLFSVGGFIKLLVVVITLWYVSTPNISQNAHEKLVEWQNFHIRVTSPRGCDSRSRDG